MVGSRGLPCSMGGYHGTSCQANRADSTRTLSGNDQSTDRFSYQHCNRLGASLPCGQRYLFPWPSAEPWVFLLVRRNVDAGSGSDGHPRSEIPADTTENFKDRVAPEQS